MEPEDANIFTIYTVSYLYNDFDKQEVEDIEFKLDANENLTSRPNGTALDEQVRTQLLQIRYIDYGEYLANEYADRIANGLKYKKQGYIAFGCSSGRWHSVAMAIRVAELLESRQVKTRLVHKHLDIVYKMPELNTQMEKKLEQDMISIAYTGKSRSRFHINKRMAFLMYELGHRPKEGDTHGHHYQQECSSVRHDKYLIAAIQILDREVVNEDTYWSEFHDDNPMNVKILHLPRFFADHYIVRCYENNNNWRDREEKVEINWPSFMINYVGRCKLYGPLMKSRLIQIMNATEKSLKQQMEQEQTKESVWNQFKFMFENILPNC